MSEDITPDLILDAQLSSQFSELGLCREDIVAFCTNTMQISACDILTEIHYEKFFEDTAPTGPEQDWTDVSSLEEITSHLFYLMNELGLDCESYKEIVEHKESMPIILRTDASLAVMALMADIGALTANLWNEASDDNFNFGRIEEDEGEMNEDEPPIEIDIIMKATSILAWVDTIAHHKKSSLRKVLLG